MSAEIVKDTDRQDEEHRFDELLCSLADDFKKYYFEEWRRELAAQRSNSQFTLLAARLEEVKQENEQLRQRVEALEDQVQMHKERLRFVYSKTQLCNEQLCEMASLLASEIK